MLCSLNLRFQIHSFNQIQCHWPWIHVAIPINAHINKRETQPTAVLFDITDFWKELFMIWLQEKLDETIQHEVTIADFNDKDCTILHFFFFKAILHIIELILYFATQHSKKWI